MLVHAGFLLYYCFLVPGAGIEPARPFYGKRRILSPLCLPVSPPGLLSYVFAFQLQIGCNSKRPLLYNEEMRNSFFLHKECKDFSTFFAVHRAAHEIWR